jgi:hypothetical protein
MTTWGSKMGEKLKQGYFRVAPYNELRPLSGDWYLLENDADFSVINDGVTRSTFSGFSRGCGTVMSVFMTEYFVYESGNGQVRIIDKDYNNHMLITLPINEVCSVLCMNNFIFVSCLNNNVLTVSKYIIVGTKYDPFYEVIDTKTIDVTAATTQYSACVLKTPTEGYLYQGEEAGVYESVKIEMDGSDFNLSIVNGSIASQIHPNMALVANNDRFLYYKPISYYADCPVKYMGTTNWSFNVYDAEDNLIQTYTIQRGNVVSRMQGAKVFLDQTDASGYLVVFDTFTSGGAVGKVRVFSFGSGTITQLYEQNTEALNVITATTEQCGFWPWKGAFPGFGYGQNNFISRKALLDMVSCNLANASNFNNIGAPALRFGNTIRWL